MQDVTAPSTQSTAWRQLLSEAPTASAHDAFDLTSSSRILFVGAHPDDETFAAGALLAALSRTGHHVHVATMTAGEAAWDEVDRSDRSLASTRQVEFASAIRELGVSGSVCNLPDGRLLSHLQGVRAALLDLVQMHRPDVIFTVWWSDPHPDHQAVGLAAQRLAAEGGIPLYGFPIWAQHWMRPDDAPQPHLFTVIQHSVDDRASRTRAEKAYVSQTQPPHADLGPVLPDWFLRWDIEYFVGYP